MAVRIETQRDGIAVVTIDNPPINALGQVIRQGFLGAAVALDADPGVRGVVLLCAGARSLRADISEFGKPPQAPHLPDVIARRNAVRSDSGSACGHGTPRSEVGRRMVRLFSRRPHAAAFAGGRGHCRRRCFDVLVATMERRGDRGRHCAADDQRGIDDLGAGYRQAGRRHRPRQNPRLRFPTLAWRADALPEARGL